MINAAHAAAIWVGRIYTGNWTGEMDRPLLCRVDESYEVFFKGIMSRETYDKLNYEACERLKQG